MLEAAKKRNKDFSKYYTCIERRHATLTGACIFTQLSKSHLFFFIDYVRDVMRVKFDRNLDQSSSLSGQSQSSFSLNKQLRSDKWNLRNSSKDGLEDQDAEDSVHEVASQKRRRGKSNLISSLPFLENDVVDGVQKQKGPDKGNVEPMDEEQSEDTILKS